MGADAVLEWEVITPQGQHVIATPTRNNDLYWALGRGGPGIYGIVLSMTVKAFPDDIVGGATLIIGGKGFSNETYRQTIAEWFAFLPPFHDPGNTATWQKNSTTFLTKVQGGK